VKALTVQQPWAWAIVHGGKDVENRTQAWGYRGPLAIHAGQRLSERGLESPLIGAALERLGHVLPSAFKHPALTPLATNVWGATVHQGAIIGVVDLVGAHQADVCEQLGAGELCSPWAEASYAEHGGRTRRDVVHLELENPRPLEVPIPCKGRLGLWTPPTDVLDQLEE
jgi:hypothetical protein